MLCVKKGSGGRGAREAVESDLEPLFYLFLSSSSLSPFQIEKAVTTEVDNCGERGGGGRESKVIREGKFY